MYTDKTIHMLKLFQYMKDQLAENRDELRNEDLSRSMKSIANDLYYEFRRFDADDFVIVINKIIDEITAQAELKIETKYRTKLDYLKEELRQLQVTDASEEEEEKIIMEENNNENSSRNQSAE